MGRVADPSVTDPTGARNVATVASKEVRDAFRNRWFLLDAGAFVVLALGLSSLGLTGGGLAGLAGFGRTAAALVNLVLLIVPLMGLSVGALSIAGERERGTLATLLAQPLTPAEVFAGKWCGLSAALTVTIGVGFGLPGLVIAASGTGESADAYLVLAGLALLLALVGLALGTLISVIARSTAIAIGLAIGCWLTLVFLGDLGILGAGLAMNLSAGQLLLLSLVNPLTAFRVAAILTTGASAETLGPSGLLLTHVLGAWLLPSLVGLLLLWAFLPIVVGYRLFTEGDAL